jgi:hypothetical protein
VVVWRVLWLQAVPRQGWESACVTGGSRLAPRGSAPQPHHSTVQSMLPSTLVLCCAVLRNSAPHVTSLHRYCTGTAPRARWSCMVLCPAPPLRPGVTARRRHGRPGPWCGTATGGGRCTRCRQRCPPRATAATTTSGSGGSAAPPPSPPSSTSRCPCCLPACLPACCLPAACKLACLPARLPACPPACLLACLLPAFLPTCSACLPACCLQPPLTPAAAADGRQLLMLLLWLPQLIRSSTLAPACTCPPWCAIQWRIVFSRSAHRRPTSPTQAPAWHQHGPDTTSSLTDGCASCCCCALLQACAGLPETGVCAEHTWRALLAGPEGNPEDVTPAAIDTLRDGVYDEDLSTPPKVGGPSGPHHPPSDLKCVWRTAMA